MSRTYQQMRGRVRAGEVPNAAVTPASLGWEISGQQQLNIPKFDPTKYGNGAGNGAGSGDVGPGPTDDLGTDLDDGDDDPGQVAAETFWTAAIAGLAGIALGFVFRPDIARLIGRRG